MGVGAGLYMYVVVVQKFTFAISSPDEFLFLELQEYTENTVTRVDELKSVHKCNLFAISSIFAEYLQEI